MKRLIYSAFFLLLTTYVCSQNLTKRDSLLTLLKETKNDSVRIKTLLQLSLFYSLTDAPKALDFAQSSLKLSEKLKSERGIASSYFRIGVAYDNTGNFQLALEYRLKELEKWKLLNEKNAICNVLGNIGTSYSNIGDNKKAMQYYILALKLSEEMGYKDQTINNLSNIATIYNENKDYRKALRYYYESLKLATAGNFKHNIAINRSNIGGVYMSQGNYSKALESFFIALEIDKSLQNVSNISTTTLNISEVYQLQGDSAKKTGNIEFAKMKYEKSLEYSFKALEIAKEVGNIFLEASALHTIAIKHISSKQFEKAKEFLTKSIDLAYQIKSNYALLNSHEGFYLLFKETNSPDKALYHYEKYIQLRDSIYSKDNEQAISELEIKYKSEKKEIENIALQQKNKLQTLELKNERNLKVGLACLLAIALCIGYLIIRQNKLKSKQSTIQFEQKLLRTQMNPHFIFNSLASIESFIYDHQPKEAGVYLSSFSRLMRLILENSSSEFINLEKELEFLNYYLTLQKLRLDDKLSYIIELGKEIDPEQILIPPMLTQPFIENAIEHGFRGSKQQGEIKINFSLINNFLNVQIIDNGIGIEKAQQQKDLHKTHKSMAMKITTERLTFLNKSKRKKLSFAITDLSNENAGKTGTKIVFLIPV